MILHLVVDGPSKDLSGMDFTHPRIALQPPELRPLNFLTLLSMFHRVSAQPPPVAVVIHLLAESQAAIENGMDCYAELNDEELIDQIVAGNPDAAAHLLIERCGPGVKYLVECKFQRIGLEFNEVVSELYLQLRRNDWRALQAFRGANGAGRSCKLSHYIHCIAARALSRKMGAAVKESSRLVALDDMGGDVADPAGFGGGALPIHDLLDLIRTLPDPMDRTALMLYKIEGKDVAEVARLLKTSPGNVYTRVSRAIKVLREQVLQGEQA